MARINERCIEHTKDEYRLNGTVVPSKGEVLGTSQDLNGAKVHVCWVHVDQPECTVVFDCLSNDGKMHLEERGPFPLEAGKWTRFQFGTYRQDLLLPVMGLRVRVQNNNGAEARTSAYGMSQLQ